MEEQLSRLERKIDGLTSKIDVLSDLPSKIDALSEDVQRIEGRLSRLSVTADATHDFAKDIWDSVESLRENVETGFGEAKADSKRGFDDVHQAIKYLRGLRPGA